ncbi:MAG: hypothetical protein HYX54_00240 [Chloroflexi bacterium]|nr:hypothetical protein [Chloroflexota bacterium]
MRRTESRLAATLTGALLLGLLAFPAAAAAQTNGPIAQTGGMTAVLPLFGSPGLTVAVTLDAVGSISGVALTPTGVVAQTSSDPSVVKFANTAGTTTVKVRAKGDKLSISAKSTRLADFIGTGTWSANVFGTGTATVSYTIGTDGSGKPTLSIGTPSVVAGVTSVVIAPTTNSGDGDEGASASGGVIFSSNGFVKRLRISIEVDRDGGAAHLRITLSGKDRQKLSDALGALVAVGNRTWSAYLCDGATRVTVTYKVNANGTVSFVSATPAVPVAVVKTGDKGFRVRFDGTKVGVAVSLRQDENGTTYSLSVKGSSGNCGGNRSDSGDSSKGDSNRGDRSGASNGGSSERD